MAEDFRERAAAIIRMYKDGKRQIDVARAFDMSPSRVREIIKRAERQEERRLALVASYGPRPDIAAMPDSTSIEVLALCDGDVHGWDVRVANLKYALEHPIETLGDLRRSSDAQLLANPNVGKRMVAELRRLCPPADRAQPAGPAPLTAEDRRLDLLFSRVRASSRARRARVIQALEAILDE